MTTEQMKREVARLATEIDRLQDNPGCQVWVALALQQLAQLEAVIAREEEGQ